MEALNKSTIALHAPKGQILTLSCKNRLATRFTVTSSTASTLANNSASGNRLPYVKSWNRKFPISTSFFLCSRVLLSND